MSLTPLPANGVDLSSKWKRHDHQISDIPPYLQFPFSSRSQNRYYPRIPEDDLLQLESSHLAPEEVSVQSNCEIGPFPAPRTLWLSDVDLAESPCGSVSSLAASPANTTPASSYGSPMPFFDMSMSRSATVGSTSSVEAESEAGMGKNLHRCDVCQRCYDSSKDLDRHGKMSNHKAYRCLYPQCRKSYCRRDVYLRHKATHKTGGHVCPYCSKISKRRDHYLQHLKSCHSDKEDQTPNSGSVPEQKSGEQDPGFKKLLSFIYNDFDAEYALADNSAATEEYDEVQKEKMRDVVRSLTNLLGTRNPALIGRLSDSVEGMNGSNMEQLAENMAGVAVLHADLNAVKAGSSPSLLPSVSRA